MRAALKACRRKPPEIRICSAEAQLLSESLVRKHTVPVPLDMPTQCRGKTRAETPSYHQESPAVKVSLGQALKEAT